MRSNMHLMTLFVAGLPLFAYAQGDKQNNCAKTLITSDRSDVRGTQKVVNAQEAELAPQGTSQLTTVTHSDLSKTELEKIIGQESAFQKNWDPGFFTNPGTHNPKKFIYMVHAVQMPGLLTDLLQNKNISTFDHFSTSIISQSHIQTFGDVGLILRVPAEKIIAASSRDMGSGSAIQRAGNKEFYDSLLTQGPRPAAGGKFG